MQTNLPSRVRQVEEAWKSLPSETQPDQAYTMKEILARHMKGMLTDTDIQRYGEYAGNSHDDADLEKLGRADMVDQYDYVNAKRDEIRERVDAERKAHAQKDAAPTPDPIKPEPVKKKAVKSVQKDPQSDGE